MSIILSLWRTDPREGEGEAWTTMVVAAAPRHRCSELLPRDSPLYHYFRSLLMTTFFKRGNNGLYSQTTYRIRIQEIHLPETQREIAHATKLTSVAEGYQQLL